MPQIAVDDVVLHVEIAGAGPTVVLVHGFPHTGAVWSDVVTALSVDHRVIVPDLRGFGASTLTTGDLDAGTLASDLEAVLGEVGGVPAVVVAIDAGVPAAFLLGMRRPDLLSRLVLIESTLGALPGAESFFADGAPWWFGFHRVPGLAERVLDGNQAEYIGWFFDQGTRERGVHPDLRLTLGTAFSRPGALRSALGVYRALPQSAQQVAHATRHARLAVPVTAVGAAPVGRALEDQLRGVADEVTGHLIAECGHIVPVDRPDALVALLRSAEQHDHAA